MTMVERLTHTVMNRHDLSEKEAVMFIHLNGPSAKFALSYKALDKIKKRFGDNHDFSRFGLEERHKLLNKLKDLNLVESRRKTGMTEFRRTVELTKYFTPLCPVCKDES